MCIRQHEGLAAVVDDVQVQVQLAGEVPVEDRLADLGAVRDVVHRDVVEAVPGEELLGNREDLRPAPGAGHRRGPATPGRSGHASMVRAGAAALLQGTGVGDTMGRWLPPAYATAVAPLSPLGPPPGGARDAVRGASVRSPCWSPGAWRWRVALPQRLRSRARSRRPPRSPSTVSPRATTCPRRPRRCSARTSTAAAACRS